MVDKAPIVVPPTPTPVSAPLISKADVPLVRSHPFSYRTSQIKEAASECAILLGSMTKWQAEHQKRTVGSFVSLQARRLFVSAPPSKQAGCKRKARIERTSSLPSRRAFGGEHPTETVGSLIGTTVGNLIASRPIPTRLPLVQGRCCASVREFLLPAAKSLCTSRGEDVPFSRGGCVRRGRCGRRDETYPNCFTRTRSTASTDT